MCREPTSKARNEKLASRLFQSSSHISINFATPASAVELLSLLCMLAHLSHWAFQAISNNMLITTRDPLTLTCLFKCASHDDSTCPTTPLSKHDGSLQFGIAGVCLRIRGCGEISSTPLHRLWPRLLQSPPRPAMKRLEWRELDFF